MADKQHRTNVTTTELTESPQDQGSLGWAKRRGEAQDQSTTEQQSAQQQEPQA